MHRSARRWVGPWAMIALGVLLGSAPPGQGGSPSRLDELQRLSPCQLESLFVQAELGAPIVGKGRGRLLYLAERRRAHAKTALANFIWRGKVVADDGSFVNHWVGGVQALHSQATLGTSWYDGRPAYVFDYPAGTPLFEQMRDEFREIEPGLYLARAYVRGPCPRFYGYLAMQIEPCAPVHYFAHP